MQHAMPKDFNVAGEAFERDTFERDTQAISDTSDAERIQTQACDAERRDAFERGELDIEDEFHMDSASIADAAHSAPTEVPWTVLSGAPSSINGECGQSAAPSSLLSSTVTASQLGSIVTAFLDAQSAILRKPGMWPVDSHAAPRRRVRWPANGEPRTPNTQPPAVPGSGAAGGGGAEHSSSFADTTIVGLPLCLLVN